MCTHMNQLNMQGIGKIGKQQCTKPEFKDGLCKKHYDKKIVKELPWGNRSNYRQATMDDLKSGRSMKLKDIKWHFIYSYRKGIINRYYAKENIWKPTDMSIDPEPFCVKTL